MSNRRPIIVAGQEGVWKSTIVRALLPLTPKGARIDGEDVGQTNPHPMDEPFMQVLRENFLALIRSFWAAGYSNVIAGSFLNDYQEFTRFRS